jgi:RHH-type proline utilization regulon transcriptional repressor/proline dehydrogenase/delta 1-pyrroline-5-carboxylate dehydrogenase
LIYQCELSPEIVHGSFFAPRAFEIARLDLLQQEVFGPILHVIRYPAARIDGVIKAINRSGYGLTLGIHSRIDATIQHIQRRARVGNCYVNRDMIGAVVGVQPFGGEGLSGTGPKAGGPDYLRRFAVERTLTVNTAAVGGNTALLSLEGE